MGTARVASWKIPLILLAVVAGWWLWSRYEAYKQYQIQQVGMNGPAISLAKESEGSWLLDWPEWNERKWDPVLFANGLPYLPPGTESPYSLQVRVDPPEAVKIGFRDPKPATGWFELSDGLNGDTMAVLDRTRARTIEYRVVRPDPDTERVAVLRVEGSNDSSLLEGVLFGMLIADVLASAAAIPLVIWLGRACIQRWLGRRQAAPIAAG